YNHFVHLTISIHICRACGNAESNASAAVAHCSTRYCRTCGDGSSGPVKANSSTISRRAIHATSSILTSLPPSELRILGPSGSVFTTVLFLSRRATLLQAEPAAAHRQPKRLGYIAIYSAANCADALDLAVLLSHYFSVHCASPFWKAGH